MLGFVQIGGAVSDVKVWVAIIAATASLIVAIINHFSTKSNQRAIEELRDAQKDRDAKRDYEYEARKRLYHECGPILFQLAELSEAVYSRIIGLAGTTVQEHSREGYNLAALLFFFLFLDNLLRRVEGQGWKGFWPCSGRFEVVVLFGMLSLVAQLVYWSRIVSGLNQEHA